MDPELERTRRLIDEARAGKREAYEELFRTYREDLARRLEGRMPRELKARVEASDVIQEALVDAVKGFESFRYQGAGSFRAWLGAILDNRVRAIFNFHLRRERRDLRREAALSLSASGAPEPALVATATSPSNAAVAREEDERIARAIERLSADQREVIRRVKLSSQPLAEVAAAMGRSENAVKKLLARALLALGEALRGRGGRPSAGP